MCGIAAVISKQNALMRSFEADAMLLKMLAAIKHRGDEFNFAERRSFERAALGTNRLAIVDQAHARQPIEDSSTRLSIVMNGEIYNFRELRAELAALGRPFFTDSDTEVVLQAYIEWGADSPNRLDGIFAFVVYDPTQNTFFAARDHVGIKPIYISEDDEKICLGSERKCFLGVAGNVQEIPPGCFWKGGRISRYVSLQAAPVAIIDDATAVLNCRKLLESAVRKQVATDLPVAVIFSGGLDSTIVLHLANKYHKDVTAFSIGTESSEDLLFARRFCAERNIPHIVTHFDDAQIGRNIRRMVFAGEFFEPVDISDMLTMNTVYAAVRANGFKIALSGDGSDEIFAGYDMFKTTADPHALTTYRVNNLHRTDLQRTDRSSMINSIECRVPFLDLDLLKFALALPFNLKVRNGVEKFVLREAFRSEIPAYMIDRPKIRMPEGIGIHDRIFKALADIHVRERPLPSIAIDSPQIRKALALFLEFGYDAPIERYKSVGKDYFHGGYFNFGDAAS